MSAVLTLRVRCARGWTLRLPGLSLFLRIGDHSAQTGTRDIVDGTVCWDQVFDLPVLCQEFCGAYELDSPLIIDGYTRQGPEPIFHSNHKLPRLAVEKLKPVSYPLHGPVFLELDLLLRPAPPELLARRRAAGPQRPAPLRPRPAAPLTQSDPGSPACSARPTTPRGTHSKTRTGSPVASARPQTPTGRGPAPPAPRSQPPPPRPASPSASRGVPGGQRPRGANRRTQSPSSALSRPRHHSPPPAISEALLVPTASDGEVAIAPTPPLPKSETPSPDRSLLASFLPVPDGTASPRQPHPRTLASPGKSLSRRSHSPRGSEDGLPAYAGLALESTTLFDCGGALTAMTEDEARQLICRIRGLSTSEQQDLRVYILGLDAEASSPEALRWAEGFVAAVQNRCDHCHQSFVWMNLLGRLLERGHREYLELQQSVAGLMAHESRLAQLQQGLSRLEEHSLRAEEAARAEMERLHRKHQTDLRATVAHWEGVVAAEALKHRAELEAARPGGVDAACQTDAVPPPLPSDNCTNNAESGVSDETLALRQRVAAMETRLQRAEVDRAALEAALQVVAAEAQRGEAEAQRRIATLQRQVQQLQPPPPPLKGELALDSPLGPDIVLPGGVPSCVLPWRESPFPLSPPSPLPPTSLLAPTNPPPGPPCSAAHHCCLPGCTTCRGPSPPTIPSLPPQLSVVL